MNTMFFMPTEEDLIFKEMFYEYLNSRGFDTWSAAGYSLSKMEEIKSNVSTLFLFLKEEVLMDNYFNKFEDLVLYIESSLSKANRLHDGIEFLLNFPEPPNVGRLKVAYNFLQLNGLNLSLIYEDINPLIQRYYLEKNVINISKCAKMMNKV